MRSNRFQTKRQEKATMKKKIMSNNSIRIVWAQNDYEVMKKIVEPTTPLNTIQKESNNNV